MRRVVGYLNSLLSVLLNIFREASTLKCRGANCNNLPAVVNSILILFTFMLGYAGSRLLV